MTLFIFVVGNAMIRRVELCWLLQRRDGDRPPALACTSLIILSSFIRHYNWHEQQEIDAFRRWWCLGLLHCGAEWLRASASDEQPHGPSPLHGSVSHWPLTLTPFLLQPSLCPPPQWSGIYTVVTLLAHKCCTKVCAVESAGFYENTA